MLIADRTTKYRRNLADVFVQPANSTRPNALLAQVHNRMPVILHPDDEEDWLSRDLTDPADLDRFYEPYPAAAMVGRPVSPRVNNTRNEGPELIAPLDPDQPPLAPSLRAADGGADQAAEK